MSTSKLNKALLEAARQNNLKRVQELIQQGADVNATTPTNWTALFLTSSPEVAILLIQHGADVNYKDSVDATPLHGTNNIDVARVLIQNGADINQKTVFGKTPAETNLHPEIVSLIQEVKKNPSLRKKKSIQKPKSTPHTPKKTPATPIEIHENEYTYSATPVSDEEINHFLNTYIHYNSDKTSTKKILFQGLKEALKTPTGRMAFRATRGDLETKRRAHQPYKINLTLSNDESKTRYGTTKSKSHDITLYLTTIKNQFPIQEEFNFQMGAILLHEMLHTRDTDDRNKTISDAVTSAFTRQISVECPYIKTRLLENISDKERNDYLKNVLNADGSLNPEKARAYSAKIQQRYTQDFLLRPGDRPLVNYALMERQLAYSMHDVHIRLLGMRDNSPEQKTFKDIQNRFGIPISYKDPINNQILKQLTPYAEQIYTSCNIDEVQHLYDSLRTRATNIDRSYFRNNQSYTAALNYFTVANDIQSNLIELALVSSDIHSNPTNQELINKSQHIRSYLLTKYQIVIPIYNQFNERVADGVDIVRKQPEKSVDVLLRESSNPNTPTHNPALAQNAQTLEDKKNPPLTPKQKNRIA